MDTTPRQATKRPRKRPPLRSYLPFAGFLCLCIVLLSLVVWLSLAVVHAVTPSAAHHHAPAAHTGATTLAQAPSPTSSPIPPSATAAQPSPPSTTTPTPSPTSTPLRFASLAPPTATDTVLVPLTPGGPLPTKTPAPTATPNGASTLAVARDVDPSGRPLEQASRFVSPALRLYAIATVHHLHSTDVLRFVFLRDGVVLPHDDISFSSGTDADIQPVSAYADYNGGNSPLPHGNYRALFYRNGVLEAATTFRVG